MGIRQPPNPSSRLGFRGLAGRPFSRSGPGLGSCCGRSRARAPRKESGLSPPSPTSPLTAWAVCILGAPELPETAPQGSPKRAGGLSEGFQEAPPGGRSDPLPSPRASAPPPGDPLSPTASLAPQDTPLRRPGLVVPPPPPPRPRPPRPAPRQAPGEPRAPTPPPERPARERDGGGDGDWAAARGRVLGREAPRLLSFSAPAPLSPPSLIAPPAAAEVGALASSPPPAGDPLLSPPLPPPLAAASSPLPERLAARRRNGKPRRGEGCELGAGDAEPGSGRRGSRLLNSQLAYDFASCYRALTQVAFF
ncbi:basic proline-rich protein-like [Mustela erminea]|uniref:basic proline-rich protein-like n=1 Tax=Mustela erminea TaxID=36723 RepID=UPI00138708D1|nr:basic proline-rich protein-like [Mustela erminea]